jgi:SAM-dependent methyltransferase
MLPKMPKRPFIRKIKRKQHGATFWDNEYAAGGENLKLSDDASDDLEKFTRWLGRQKDTLTLNRATNVVDVGCGNGRNLVYLAQHFGCRGYGFDISSAAIAAAKRVSTELPLKFEVRSLDKNIEIPDESQHLVLDMMASHFLNQSGRQNLRDEIYRILKPGGWLFLKTFLRDEDLHTERLLKEFPTDEPGTYIHPVIGVPEHTYYEAELLEFLEEKFIVHKVYRSHKHISHGKARKRRTVSVYAQRDPYAK